MFAVVFLMIAYRSGMLTPIVQLSQYESVPRELDLYVPMGQGTHELVPDSRLYPMLQIQAQLELRLRAPGMYWLFWGLLEHSLSWQPVENSPNEE